MASVVGATNNGVGIVGIYPDAVLRVWDASPFGFLNEGAAIEGIYEAARRGAGVINLSFGGEDDDPLLDDAIRFAFRSGSLVVAAAGNDGARRQPAELPRVLSARSHRRRDDREQQRRDLLDRLADRRHGCPRRAHPGGRAADGGADRLQHYGQRHELRVAARRRRGSLGLDDTAGPRQHAVVRVDAPVGDRHRAHGDSTTRRATGC